MKSKLKYVSPWVEIKPRWREGKEYKREGHGGTAIDEGHVQLEQMRNIKGQLLFNQYNWRWEIQIDSHDFFDDGWAPTLEEAKEQVDEIFEKHGFRLLDGKHANFM